jgi:hypothetical protein
MSQNNIPTNLPNIEKIIQRITMAERTNQKEIRLTLQEGKDLVTDLALVTSRLASTINEVNQSLKIISENTKNIEVKFDGGGF